MKKTANINMKKYQQDPCAFVREVLGVTTNYSKQDDVLRSVRDNPRTALRASNGAGKTVTAAEIVLWAVCCFPECSIITTASSTRQVEKQLWGKIHRLYDQARYPLGGELLGTELRFSKTGSSAIGFSTDHPGLFEGFHAKRVLVVVDEAKSVEQVIFDAVERVLSSGSWVRLLVMSSPGGPVGAFYDIFTKHQHLYALHHISAADSPFIRPEWIEERKREWGETSSLFQSSVLGEFPENSRDGTLISLAGLLQLQQNPPAASGNQLRAGIDLAAGGGDETAVAVFCGNQQIALECWREADTMVTVGKIIQIIQRHGIPPANINVDADGLGLPIVHRLQEEGFLVQAIHNGGVPSNKERFLNFSAEAWMQVAEMIERKEIVLARDEKLISQLASRRQKLRSDGRVQLESKEEMRRRGLPSPDRADAVVLALVNSASSTTNLNRCAEVMKNWAAKNATGRSNSQAGVMASFFPGVKGVFRDGRVVPLGSL